MKNQIKRIIFIAAILFLIISAICIYTGSKGEASKPKKKLSEMSPEEQVAFVENQGIKYPSYTNADDWTDTIVRIIKHVEEDPNYSIVYSYYESLRFGEEIKKAVNEYYGRTPQDPESLPKTSR